MRQLSYKTFILGIGVFISSISYGQNIFLPNYYDTVETHGYQLEISGGIDYQTSRVRNDFTDKFLFGGHIDNDLKQKTFDRLYNDNTLGGGLTSNIRFRDYKSVLFKKKPRFGYQIDYGFNVLAGGSYGKDVFELAFFGNQGTQGRKLDLGNLQMNMQAFHKLAFGFFDKKTKSSVSLAYIHGTNLIDFSMFDGSLRTEDSTNNLSMVLDGHFHQSNKKKGFFAPNGWGLALDAEFVIPIKWFKGKKAYFQIKLNNLGFIRWNKNSSIYEKDTVYEFNGFEIDQLLNAGNIFGNGNSILDTLNISEREGRVTTWLPASFSFAKIYDVHNTSKVQPIFGIQILSQGGFRPIGYAGVVYRPVNWFYGGIHLMYGGFGQLRGGLQLNFRAKEKYAFHISTNDLLGLVTKIGNGRSLHFGMKFDL